MSEKKLISTLKESGRLISLYFAHEKIIETAIDMWTTSDGDHSVTSLMSA